MAVTGCDAYRRERTGRWAAVRLAGPLVVGGLLLGSGTVWVAGSVEAANPVITVVSSADSGVGTLRAAITSANSSSGADTIEFAIPGCAPCTITLASELPTVSSAITIDGTTQAPSLGRPPIIIDGTAFRANGNGAVVKYSLGNNSTLRGTALVGGALGVMVQASSNVTIDGNWIGTADGSTSNGNRLIGVYLGGGGGIDTAGVRISNNVIVGNETGISTSSFNGVNMVTGMTIDGNLIGVGSDGSTAVGNTSSGISLDQWARNSNITGNTIANNGTYGVVVGNQFNNSAAASGNVISRNTMAANPSGLLRIVQGANGGQQAPSIGSAYGTTVTGTVASGSAGETVEVFAATCSGTSATSVRFLGDAVSTSGGSYSVSLTNALVDGSKVVATSTSASGTSPFTACFTVATPNRAPVAVAENYETARSTTLTVAAPGVLSNDTDADGNSLTAVLDSQFGFNGSVTLDADGGFTFVPFPGFSGGYWFKYRAYDGAASSNLVTVWIDTRPPPPAVTGVSGSLNANHDAVVSFDPVTDPFYGTVSYTATCSSNNGGTTKSTSGSSSPLTVVGLSLGASYTCVVRGANIAGEGDASSPTSALVMPAPPNATPVAVGEHYEVASDTQLVVSAPGVLANDTDADGDAITASLVSVSSNGTADLAADGSFTYTPPPHFGGLFLISYRVFDGTAYSNTVTAAIDVRPPPPAVTGVSGSLNVDHDAVVSFTPISDVNFYGSISYTATCTSANGGATRTGTAATTPVIVSNLTPGTSYTCVVRGSNIAGPGEASAPTAALDVPAPPNVGVTQGVSGNAVVFEAPLGSTVTSFARLASVPAGTPSNVVLPEGLYSFRVAGTVVGEAVRFTFKYTPQPGVVVNGYLKYVGGSWVRLPSQLVDLSVAGQVTITIVDGGAYDDDGLANGIVVDPGAPAVITAGVPEAPSVVSLAIDDDRQAVIGYTPGWDGGLPITEYYAECHDLAGAGLFSGGAAITTLAMYVPNTVAGVSFNCTVQAKNALGWGPMSTASSTLVMPTTPGRASAVNLSQFANSIVVHFTQPAFLGFMPDITFLATCSSTDGGIVRSQTGTANPITVPNVIGGLSYVCSVVSGNSAGNGPVSAPVAPFAMGPTAPAAPSNVVAALVGTSSATVSFSPGPSGGSPITSYAASCTASGRPTITGTGPSGPISVSGLVAGASYSCTVTATNLFGTSAASAASAPLLVPTVPGAPTGVSGTRSVATAAVVSFVPPASNGGSPILSYRATCSSTGALDVSQTGASSPITVSGLLVTAAYTCRVVATNAVGDSLPSAATATLPGATVPGAPTSVSVTVDADRVAQIAFTAPVSNGGTVITSYSARCVPTAAGQATVTASGASSPIPVTGLAAGRTYNCSVTANNVVGASAAASAPAVTMPTTPGAPTGLTLTISAVRQGSVAFVPPVYVGTTAINQYSATCTTTTVGGVNPAAVTGTASPLAVPNLTAGATYTCRVTARNTSGVGPASLPSNAATAPSAPGAPTSVIVTIDQSSRATVIRFQPPTSNGGAPITSYRANCTSTNGGVARATTGTRSPLVVATLTAGAVYTCAVTATNGAGTGPATNVSVSVPGLPGAPTSVAVELDGSGRTALVTYSPPAAVVNAADIIGYRATCTSTNGGTARTGVGTGGVIVVTTLSGPNSVYNCSVAAITAAADGPSSTAVSVTTF